MAVKMNPDIGSGYSVKKNFLRIGDTQFYVPPTSIKVYRQTQLEMKKMIRSKSSSPKESGYYEQIIELNIIFPDLYAINNELRPLLAQSKKFPFLPIENAYINKTLAIPAVTISNITCQTVVGFPNCISAVIQCYAFNPASYVYGEDKDYDEMFNWPLFRWHYNRNLEPEAKDNGLTYFRRLTSDLGNDFKFKIAAEDELEYMREWRKRKNAMIRKWKLDKKNTIGLDSEDWKSLYNSIFSSDEESIGYFNDEDDEKEFFKNYNEHMSKKMNTYDVSYDTIQMPGLVLLDMSVSMNNDIATHKTQMSPYSTHQFLGSSDVTANMRFLAQDESVLNAFDAALNRAAYMTREFNKEMSSGFIKFEHQLTRLFGIENVVIGDVSYNTVENQPGVHEINLTVNGYNRAEKRLHETEAMMSGEEINKLWEIKKGEDSRLPSLIPGYSMAYAVFNTPVVKNALNNMMGRDSLAKLTEEKEAVYNANMLNLLKAIELYPDLELPTYSMVKDAGFEIPDLNDGVFVDPDFFMVYTTEGYYHNVLLKEMGRKYNINLSDGSGGAASLDTSDPSSATLNDVTAKEKKEIDEELGVKIKDKDKKKIEEEKEVAKKENEEANKKRAEMYKTPENLKKEVVEAKIRDEADSLGFSQNYAVAFAKAFDEDLKHSYEKGTNKNFGQVKAEDKTTVIEMSSADKYVVGKFANKNYVGVMRVPFTNSDQITNIYANISEGVGELQRVYKNSAKPIMDTAGYYKNFSEIYKTFDIKEDGAKKNDDKMKLVFATIIYMGGERDLKNYISGVTNKLPKEYTSLGKEVLSQLKSLGKKWSDKEIIKKLEDIKVKEYKNDIQTEDTSDLPADFENNYVYDVEDDTVVRNGMLIDALKYDKRGRMVRAFPTFLLTFIDEGQYVGNVKMADQHFNYRAVQDIVFNQSRKQAASTLTLELSNIYETLSDAEKAEDLSHQGFKDMLNYWMRPGAYAKETQERTRNMDEGYYKSIFLRTGVRVHFRMGYGSNPVELPTLLNGPITSMKNNGSSMTVIAQSDAIELTRSMAAWFSPDDETTGFLWAKKEPSDILDQILMDDRGLVSNVKTLLSNKEYERHSLGLMHFGTPGTSENADALSTASMWATNGAKYGFLGGVGTALTAGIGGGLLGWAKGKVEGKIERKITPININVHKSTGIANGTDTMWNKIGDMFGIGQGDEDGVAFSLFDKTIWDVACINAALGSDMLAAVHPFGFRNTLFVGKPYFPIHYDYNVDMKENQVIGTNIKTFRQVHGVDSFTNIISNNIEATEENMYTTAVGSFMRNGELAATDTAYVDTNIWPEKQKNVTIDTATTAKGFRMLKAAGHIPIMGGIADTINANTGQWLFDEGVALKMTYAGLREHVKEMYDGYLTIMGQASIKPYDYIVLQDTYTNMGGVLEVREVTHMMNSDVGFISIIKPDAIVYNSDARIGNYTMGISQLMSSVGLTFMMRGALSLLGFRGNFPTLQALWAATKKTWSGSVKVTKADKLWDKVKDKIGVRRNPIVAGTTGDKESDIVSKEDKKVDKDLRNPDISDEEIKNAEKRGLLKKIAMIIGDKDLEDNTIKELLKKGVVNMRSSLAGGTFMRDTIEKMESINDAIEKTSFEKNTKASKAFGKTLKGGKWLGRLGRGTIQAAIGSVSSLAGPVGWIGFAIEYAVSEAVVATVGEYLNRWLANRQCCIIIPIKRDGVRLLAGMNGHKGCVAGDSPSTFDSIVSSGPVSTILSFIGVDASQYQNVPKSPSDLGVSSFQAQAKTTDLLKEIKSKFSTVSKNIKQIGDKSSSFLHRLDVAGVKARVENNKSLLDKLSKLVPNYKVIKETYNTFINSVGSKMKEALSKLKGFFKDIWGDIKNLFGSVADLFEGDDSNEGDSSCTSDMPTYKDYKGPEKTNHQIDIPNKIKGTDKWNDAIYKIAKKKKVNPILVKCMMASESEGRIISTFNSDGCIGIMQVKKDETTKNMYDWDKMAKDGEYGIAAGCDVILRKIKESGSKSLSKVAERYMGTGSIAIAYRDHILTLYKGLGYDPNKTNTTSQVVKGECKETGGSVSADGTENIGSVDVSKWPAKLGTWGDAEQKKHKVSGNSKVLMSFNGNGKTLNTTGTIKIRHDTLAITTRVASEYKEKFGKRMHITSSWRSETNSWHETGWCVDIDTNHVENGNSDGIINFKDGTHGYAKGTIDYEETLFIADRMLHYGMDGVYNIGTNIKKLMVKKYPGITWKDHGSRPYDHIGHIHFDGPNKNRVKK